MKRSTVWKIFILFCLFVWGAVFAGCAHAEKIEVEPLLVSECRPVVKEDAYHGVNKINATVLKHKKGTVIFNEFASDDESFYRSYLVTAISHNSEMEDKDSVLSSSKFAESDINGSFQISYTVSKEEDEHILSIIESSQIDGKPKIDLYFYNCKVVSYAPAK